MTGDMSVSVDRKPELVKGDLIRRRRAEMLNSLRHTENPRRIAQTWVLSPCRELEGTPLIRFLMKLPRVGLDRALIACQHIGASEQRKLGELTGRQRELLCGLLADPPATWR